MLSLIGEQTKAWEAPGPPWGRDLALVRKHFGRRTGTGPILGLPVGCPSGQPPLSPLPRKAGREMSPCGCESHTPCPTAVPIQCQGWPRDGLSARMVGCLQEQGLGFWPRTGPAARKLLWGDVALVLCRLQLVEPLDDHAVEFLELVYVLPLSCQSSRHVVHLASGLNFKMENRELHGRRGPCRRSAQP